MLITSAAVVANWKRRGKSGFASRDLQGMRTCTEPHCFSPFLAHFLQLCWAEAVIGKKQVCFLVPSIQ